MKRPNYLLCSLGLLLAGTMRSQPDAMFRATEPLHLGHAAADGTLYLRIALSADGRELPFELEHRLQADCHGRCRSAWGIPQLEASLIPADAGSMRLTLPGGQGITLPAVVCDSRQFVSVADGVRARAVADREMEIEVGDRYYRFAAGQLIAIESEGQRFVVEGSGSRVGSVTGAGGAIVQASYNAVGELVSLSCGRSMARCVFSDSGLLSRVVDGNDREIAAFEYTSGLLLRYRRQSGPWIPIEWSANPRHQHGLLWLLETPRHVARVGSERYEIERTKTAIAIREFDDGRPAGALSMNFWTHTLSRQDTEWSTPTAN